jgi:hypothetical protein
LQSFLNGVKQLKLRIASTRLLLNEKYAKLIALSYRDDYKVNSAEKEIVQLMQSQTVHEYRYGSSTNDCVLMGTSGRLILELAESTDKLFLANADNTLRKPLARGEPGQVLLLHQQGNGWRGQTTITKSSKTQALMSPSMLA